MRSGSGSAQDEALLIKTQILLDRARFSPGEIDGRTGENYQKALAAFAEKHGIASKGDMTDALWQRAHSLVSGPCYHPLHAIE